jgi:hypothetical protein
MSTILVNCTESGACALYVMTTGSDDGPTALPGTFFD